MSKTSSTAISSPALLAILLLFTFSIVAKSQIKTYNVGQAFTCIAVDSNYNIWAGTDKKGLYLLDKKINPTATQFMITTPASNVNIQTLAADQSKNIWVGHSGINSTYGGGGIDQVNIDNVATVKLFSPDRNAECFTFQARDGIATLNSASITVDKNGTIWSAHKSHELYVVGFGSTRTRYITTPGSISYKFVSDPVFQSKGMYRDYFQAINSSEDLLYPANTCNFQSSPPIRNCYAVACGNNEAWVSVDAYIEKRNGKSFPARLLKYDLSGNFIEPFDFTSIGIPGSGVFTGIWVTPKGNVWVTTSTGLILVREGSTWQTVTLPPTIPQQISPNNNAITGDLKGNVYIGTNTGLIAYNGGSIQLKTSFSFYSTTDGLPSANVTGVAVDKKGSVWMATNGGVAQLMATRFSVYNLIHPKKKEEMKAEKYSLVEADKKSVQIDESPIEIMVAADSSTSTLVAYTGDNPITKVMNILDNGKQVANDPNKTSEYGYLEEILRNEDSLVYLYRSPSFVYNGEYNVPKYDFVLKEKLENVTLVEGKLKIYHSPVLMVHGVWSSIESLGSIEKYLLTKTGNYKNFQLKRIWYPTVKHKEPVGSAWQYHNEIPDGIDVLLKQCRENKLSAGKVNIVGHSRGGIFARYYLQSNFVPYRNDVNSLITINSPHWGSQAANMILDERSLILGSTVGSVGRWLALDRWDNGKDGDDPNGAVELKVNAAILRDKLNHPTFTDRNKVPVHAITGTYKFNLSYDDIIRRESNNVPAASTTLFSLRALALQLVGKPADFIMRSIFNGEENDVVVPLSSQIGGLEEKNISRMVDNYCHSNKNIYLTKIVGTMDMEDTHRKVSELLQTEVNDPNGQFIKGGFKGPSKPLEYNFLDDILGSSLRPTQITNNQRSFDKSTIKIHAILQGQTYTYGQQVPVTVLGSSDIKAILVGYTSPSLEEVASDVEQSSSFTFSYPVPKHAAGKVFIVAYGFSEAGLVAVDTSHINIAMAGSALLDSIKIENNSNNALEVHAKDSIYISVLGYYSDTVRRIAHLNGVNYSFRTDSIAKASPPNRVTGILPRQTDLLRVTYLGKTDSVAINVTDSIQSLQVPESTLPVSFSAFSGEFNNNQVRLYWSTTQEWNNRAFEIEYSADGLTYETIGTVLGKGSANTVTHYTYVSNRFIPGKNYYRLKQIDFDGNYKYSTIVAINVGEMKQSLISIYPNPTHDKIMIGIGQYSGEKLQLVLADITGRKIFSKLILINNSSIPVTLPQMSKGVYVVTILSNKGERLLSDKLIIQ